MSQMASIFCLLALGLVLHSTVTFGAHVSVTDRTVAPTDRTTSSAVSDEATERIVDAVHSSSVPESPSAESMTSDSSSYEEGMHEDLGFSEPALSETLNAQESVFDGNECEEAFTKWSPWTEKGENIKNNGCGHRRRTRKIRNATVAQMCYGTDVHLAEYREFCEYKVLYMYYMIVFATSLLLVQSCTCTGWPLAHFLAYS